MGDKTLTGTFQICAISTADFVVFQLLLLAVLTKIDKCINRFICHLTIFYVLVALNGSDQDKLLQTLHSFVNANYLVLNSTDIVEG